MQDNVKELTLFDNYDFIERIETLMNGYESAEVEFKSAKGGFPRSLWETYSAFANTQGGVIVLGVKERDGRFALDGLTLEQVRKYKKEFWDNVNNKAHCSANILRDEDVQDGEYNGSYVLVFNVPRAPRSKIPVYLHNNPDNTFKRNHEGDYRCDTSEVRRMFADADIEDNPRDYKILPEFTIERDIDKATLEQYRRMVATKRPDHPWLLLDDKNLLIKLKGYREDRREDIAGLTLAGLLMFGKADSITDAYACPQYFPDYREYFSPDPNDRWTDRIYPDGTWEANLFQFYYRVYPKLAAVLPKPFALKDGVREDETPTHIALREAFINALVHCDYSVDSNIIIELHKDCYIFSNPGSLLLPISKYYQGGNSVCRNKALQTMFMLLGSAEKAGSGADKIIQGWKTANYRNPRIEEITQPDKVVWIDGSEAQAEALRAEACSTGEMIKLNQEKLPGCYLHRTAVNDVARVEGRTFICTSKKEDAGNINNWMDPAECKAKLTKLYNGSMKGRTMYVIPYSMS
ncbi:MAG: putative DNA binding domain-containing protein, partial [Alistipes sp.]|nr:putative DNA binding domain-containing protein [Alistipes sp.]